MSSYDRIVIAIAILLCGVLAYEHFDRPRQRAREAVAYRVEKAAMEDSCFKLTGRPCPPLTQEQLDQNAEEVSEGIRRMLRGED